MDQRRRTSPAAQRTRTRVPNLAKASPAAQVCKQGKEHAPETRTTQPHPKDDNRNTAPHQGAPGRQTSKTQYTPQGPQDQDASSLSDPNPDGAHTLNPTSSQAQVRRQGKKPILRPGRYTPTKRTRTGTLPRVKTPDPAPTPTPLEPIPWSPHLPQPKYASREADLVRYFRNT